MIRDFIQKAIIVLSLEYIIFFSAEVILPGVIASVFNINILLGIVVLLIGILISFSSGKKYVNNQIKQKQLNNKTFLLFIVFLLAVSIVALYKVSIVMILVYIIIISSVTKILWSNQ